MVSSSDYDQSYYEHYKHRPYERSKPWLDHFNDFADRIVSDLNPRSAIDMGCALGMLVEALRDRGVEAFGVDISDFAVGNAREDVRPYLRQGSVTDPLDRRYDVIICIEVLEHLVPADAERAVENIATHTDDVIFSSTPDDFRELTHVNVRGPDYWAGLFARHGMFRDVDYEPVYAADWAVRFRRTADPVPSVVRGYERLSDRLTRENRELRAILGEAEARRIAAESDARSARAETGAAAAALEMGREAEDRARKEMEAMQATVAWRAAELARRLFRRH